MRWTAVHLKTIKQAIVANGLERVFLSGRAPPEEDEAVPDAANAAFVGAASVQCTAVEKRRGGAAATCAR